MRHRYGYRRFTMKSAHRRAMFRDMLTSLLREESCETTVDRAKELRSIAERLITVARTPTLAGKRKAYSYLKDKDVVHKLFAEIGPRFSGRPGGYTRIVRTRTRAGDGADLASISLVDISFASKVKDAEPAAPTAAS